MKNPKSQIRNPKSSLMGPLKRRNALSGREFEVMVLVSSGKYNKEIADELECGITTIKKHLQHIFPKLEVQNRTEATLKFLKISNMLNH
jgi:DNA-binding NarL/FixJ family response regulator